MKHERFISAWLLPVMSTVAGMFARLGLLVVPPIAEGFRLIRRGKPDQRMSDALAEPPLAAEATLAQVLRRKAYRCLGYRVKLVKLELAGHAADNIELMARISCHLDLMQASRAHQRTKLTSCFVSGRAYAARPRCTQYRKIAVLAASTALLFPRQTAGQRPHARAWRMTEGTDASARSPQRHAPRPRSEDNSRSTQLA
jgi:hypothetical protein